MPYRVTLTRDARRSLSRISRPDQERLAQAIDALSVDPRPPDARFLQGSEGFLRIRVGDYRVVYFVIEAPGGEATDQTVEETPDRADEAREMTKETKNAAQPTEESVEQMPEVRIIRIGHRRDIYRRPLLRRPKGADRVSGRKQGECRACAASFSGERSRASAALPPDP